VFTLRWRHCLFIDRFAQAFAHDIGNCGNLLRRSIKIAENRHIGNRQTPR